MPIVKKNMYIAKCDICNKFFSSSDNTYDCFETEKEMIERIEDEDWQKKGKKIFCDECRTY